MAERAHLLAEIKENITSQDAIKARLVLGYMENIDKNTRESLCRALCRKCAPDGLQWRLSETRNENRRRRENP